MLLVAASGTDHPELWSWDSLGGDFWLWVVCLELLESAVLNGLPRRRGMAFDKYMYTSSGMDRFLALQDVDSRHQILVASVTNC